MLIFRWGDGSEGLFRREAAVFIGREEYFGCTIIIYITLEIYLDLWYNNLYICALLDISVLKPADQRIKLVKRLVLSISGHLTIPAV